MNDLCEAIEYKPSIIQRLVWKFQAWKRRDEPGNTELHAIREFKAAGYLPIGECEDGPNKWMQENVLELIRVFSKQGHSGFSAPYCIDTFKKLAMHEPLVPLSGNDDEWNEIGDGVFQNKRCSHVFKQADRFNGQAYDINGRIFREPNGCCYTSAGSCIPVTFPYSPMSEYVDAKPSEATE
jgi:hypothetical protein